GGGAFGHGTDLAPSSGGPAGWHRPGQDLALDPHGRRRAGRPGGRCAGRLGVAPPHGSSTRALNSTATREPADRVSRPDVCVHIGAAAPWRPRAAAGTLSLSATISRPTFSSSTSSRWIRSSLTTAFLMKSRAMAKAPSAVAPRAMAPIAVGARSDGPTTDGPTIDEPIRRVLTMCP